MPTYEYKCPNGHLLEVFHGMNDPSPTSCSECGASPLVRVLHAVAVHYKGSGFYSTDYGRGGKKAADAASSDGGGSGDSSSTPSTSTESTSGSGSGSSTGDTKSS